MAIFRCNKCGHLREVGNDYLGKSVKCPKCDQITTIHDTIPFIRALIKKYIGQKHPGVFAQGKAKILLPGKMMVNTRLREIQQSG